MESNGIILVIGDSYANYGRFKQGIEQEFLRVGQNIDVVNLSFPGQSCSKILHNTQEPSCRTHLSSIAPLAMALIVGGVNDVVQRRGARQYADSVRELADELSRYTERVYVMELVAFDENSHCSRLPGLVRNRFFGLVRDREAGRIARYRDAAAAAFGASGRLVETRSFLETYEPTWFKDGVHLTPEHFEMLAHHVGRQLAAVAPANP